jgi:SagB-type dehydrogenase family enzyme
MHRYPYGGTYRFEPDRPPLPAVKELTSDIVVGLPKPDLDAISASDAPFAAVVESRRSLRRPGPQPLTISQLGEFLYRSARIRGRRATEHEEISNRPYPGGGADYELEIYPIVQRVAGVDAGLYWYDPLGHALVKISGFEGLVQRFAADIVHKAPPSELPDVLFAITARFGRLTYKYQSIPYAVALKDVGVLYQTFYLTATAMGLAPCAVGGGDSDLFATASGLSPFVEPQIGEFLLSTRHPDEFAATLIPSAR